MAKRKRLSNGIGAVVTVYKNFLHPRKVVCAKYPNANKGDVLNELLVVGQDEKTVNKRRQMCVVMQHVNFDYGQLLHSVSRHCKVEQEGATEHFFNDTIQDDPEGGGDVAAVVREEELVDVQEIVNEDASNFRAQGFGVDDDNEPAPENIPKEEGDIEDCQHFAWGVVALDKRRKASVLRDVNLSLVVNADAMLHMMHLGYFMSKSCFATMYCSRFSLATQGLLWPEAVNTITKIGNSLLRPGLALDPHRAWYGKDAVPNRIIGHLQPFGRIAYVTNRDKLKVKLDARVKKCVFVGYAQDHSGDTYKFYDTATKQTIMFRDVHQWMEWHGRITATDDLDLFTELEKLMTDSIILPALPDILILSEEDFPDDSAVPDLISRTSITEDDPEEPVPTGVAASARRNLTSEFNEGDVTRSRARQDVSRRNDDTVEESNEEVSLEEFVDYLLVLNASLESDPKPGVPKNYKELVKSKDKKWLKLMNDKLGNFLKRCAWNMYLEARYPRHASL